MVEKASCGDSASRHLDKNLHFGHVGASKTRLRARLAQIPGEVRARRDLGACGFGFSEASKTLYPPLRNSQNLCRYAT